MEYEQKYEEVLGRVKELLNSAKNQGHIIVRVEDIENAFPEIQENKDEKIRKEIVDFIVSSNKYGTNERCEAWLAWLEKQKNTPDKEYVFRPLAGDTIEKAAEKAVELDGNVVLAFNGAYIPVCNRTKNEIVAEYLNWVKKQGERKSAKLDGADEKIRKWLINEIKIKHHNLDEENIEFVDKAIAWLEKQGKQTNPYSGISFEYNGHIWGMCARDNGVDILLDKQLFKHLDTQGEQKPYGQRKECKDCQFNYAGECKGLCKMKRDEQKPADNVEPKFNIGDTMRTWREAANGYTDGMPVVVSIDNEYYHCTNELIAIKNQDDYEFPPINVKQNPVDKVKPKFHPRDWVIDNFGNTYQIETATEIESEHIFGYTIVGGGYFNDNSNVRLWTIQDAKDGDVLVDAYGNIGIFEKCYDFDWVSCCSLGNNGGFQYFTVEHENEKTYPATKEQRDLFFSKMKEAGWEWYGDKKELCYKYLSNYEI